MNLKKRKEGEEERIDHQSLIVAPSLTLPAPLARGHCIASNATMNGSVPSSEEAIYSSRAQWLHPTCWRVCYTRHPNCHTYPF